MWRRRRNGWRWPTTAAVAVPPPPLYVTTRSAHPTQLGGRRARPCRRVVLSGNTHPGRKPRRTHTRGVDRGETFRATNTSYVNRSLLACVEGLEETHASPSYPVCSPDTLRKPHPDTLEGRSENPQRNLPSGPMGPVPPGPGGTRRRRAVDSAACWGGAAWPRRATTTVPGGEKGGVGYGAPAFPLWSSSVGAMFPAVTRSSCATIPHHAGGSK